MAEGQQQPPASALAAVPYGDPAWQGAQRSPYYTDSHRRFRAAMRAFVEAEVAPRCHEWDEAKRVPPAMWRRCSEAGFLAGVVGPPWPTQYAGAHIAGGVRPEEFDAFHELILSARPRPPSAAVS